MKVCLDRRIDDQDRLSYILHFSKHKYSDLKREFKELDKRFDSNLFFHDVADNIQIDNKIISRVIKELYRINFAKLNAHIIGEVYEKYLHEMFDEESGLSDEEKENQGIVYTPQRVVKYMIDNSLGARLAKVKGLQELRSLRLLDPACGSGSMLLGAFESFYQKYRSMYGGRKNSFDIAREILTKNLYGIDLDPRAVQVAQLNLMIKALEKGQFKELKDRQHVMPDLSFNIRCANSLITAEYGEGKAVQKQLQNLKEKFHMTDNKKYKDSIVKIEKLEQENYYEQFEIHFQSVKEKKPIDYKLEFCEVFQKGGFDVLIANPPYIDSEAMTKHQSDVRDFIVASDFYECTQGNWDIYIAFLELGMKLLNPTGQLAFITPDKWIAKPFGDAFREKYIDNIIRVCRIGRTAFPEKGVDAVVTFMSKRKTKKMKIFDITDDRVELMGSFDKALLKPPYAFDFLFSKHLKLLDKVGQLSGRLIDLGECENACATSDAYKLKDLIKDSGRKKPDEARYLRVINTGTIGQYTAKWGEKPMTYLHDEYLRPVVQKRKFLSEFQNTYAEKALKRKLIIKGLTRLDACLDVDGDVIPGKSTLIISDDSIEDLKLLASILNSKLALFYIKERYPAATYNTGTSFTTDMINKLPIPAINPQIKQALIGIVDKILRIDEVGLDPDEQIEEVKDMRKKIDGILYEVYDLASRDIEDIEGEGVAEMLYLKFQAERISLTQKELEKLWLSKSQVERDAILEGFSEREVAQRVSRGEVKVIRELSKLTRE